LGDSIGSSHRAGKSSYVRLLDGEEGSPGNFSVVIAKSPGRYSPRHRHNFEQFRFQLQGTANYGRTGVMKPGMLGYFPEGTHYGPQTQDEGEYLETLALQFGGPSGSGYLGRSAQAALTEELRKFGEFKNGAFRRNPDVPGKRNLDAFEAIWEYANRRPMAYPQTRYDNPVLMCPDGFEWVPIDGADGVFQKHLGTYSECESGASMIKNDAGARFDASGGRDIYFVLKGSGEIGGAPYRRSTTVYLDDGERTTFSAGEVTEILHFHLPDVKAIEARAGASALAAAE
jgi:hypothetical protein